MEIFNNLYFKKKIWSLRSRKSKIKFKIKFKHKLKKTILDTNDITSIIKFMLDLRDGKGDVDDIDHLEIEVRSGELVENQFRIGLLRMERTVKEKMSTFLEIESAMPQDLINAKPITTSKRFFCNLTTFTIYGSNKPFIRNTHKRRVSALDPVD